jgi:hypothetical protein
MPPSDPTRGTTRVYEPCADEGHEQDALAPRPMSLDGKVVGLLNNTKDLVEILLDEVENLLHADYPRAQFRHFRKQSVSGAAADLLEELATCDAVVTAVGD